MKALSGAEYIVADYAVLFGGLNGLAKTLYGVGVFCADVYVSLGRAAGDTCDYHALEHLVGIALHDGAVHESAGVTLVAVADDVFDGRVLVSGYLRPFLAGREARTAAAAQTRVGDLGDDLVGSHVEQGLFKRGISADGDILLYALGGDVAAVGESHAGLALVERYILLAAVGAAVVVIYESVYDFALEYGAFDYLIAVLRLYLHIKDTCRLNADKRSKGAQTVAAAGLEAYGLGMVDMLFDGKLHGKAAGNEGVVETIEDLL